MRGPELNPGVSVEIGKPQEACGLVGVYLLPSAECGPIAQYIAQAGIHQLGHRGKAMTGLAVAWADQEAVLITGGEGDAGTALGRNTLLGQDGWVSMAHGRYATSSISSESTTERRSDSDGLQPIIGYTDDGRSVAIGHNGDYKNADEVCRLFGYNPSEMPSDSAVGHQVFVDALNDGMTPIEAGRHLSRVMTGAYALTIMVDDHLYALRDPWGFRPLHVAELKYGMGWMAASEQPAFQGMAQNHQELPRATMVEFTAEGPVYHTLLDDSELAHVPPSLCGFEYVYFSRPDSVHNGVSVENARVRKGEILASEAPVEADIVVGSPQSGLSAAEGYAYASGIRMKQGLIKNPSGGDRGFMAPEARQLVVSSKLHANEAVVAGQRVVLVDDSIVRGDTMRVIVQMLRDAGATEVHVRIASLPYKFTCEFGMDTKNPDELIASQMKVEEIRHYIEADSLAFISEEGYKEGIGVAASMVCMKCMTGVDPTTDPGYLANNADYIAKYLANRAA